MKKQGAFYRRVTLEMAIIGYGGLDKALAEREKIE